MCDVALSRSASYCVGSCYHAVRQLGWCCFIAHRIVLCTVVLSRSASYCVGLRYHVVRRIVYCRAITHCVILCGVTLSRSASYCVGSCYHALRRIALSRIASYCVGSCYHAPASTLTIRQPKPNRWFNVDPTATYLVSPTLLCSLDTRWPNINCQPKPNQVPTITQHCPNYHQP